MVRFKQIIYFMLPEDYPPIFEYCRKHDIVYFDQYLDQPEVRICHNIEENKREEGGWGFLCKRKDIPKLTFRVVPPREHPELEVGKEIPSSTLYTLDTTTNPVIELGKGYWDGSRLVAAMTCFVTQYEESGQWICNEELTEWGSQFYNWLQKTILKRIEKGPFQDLYASQTALDLMAKEEKS